MRSIISIAYYEAKTLYRSWFFKIFAILSILIVSLFNLAKFVATNDVDWELMAVPANLPYTNFQILNFIQSIIAIFLAADFLRRDKKLDTTETIYIKPMSNEVYILGKLLGNLWIFISLNLIVISIGVLFNFGLQDMPVDISSYFIYLGLISIPSLIFIFGLSFLLMTLIKNQALTFLSLLAYIGITLFYLQDKMYYLFDYMGYKIPMTISQIVGFSHFEDLLIQRSAFLLFGLGAVVLTMVLLKRLPQSSYSKVVSTVISIVLFAAGIGMGTTYYLNKTNEVAEREEQLIRNEKYVDFAYVTVEKYDMELTHSQDKIAVTSDITIINRNSSAIDEMVFRLNKGLSIDSISGGSVKREENLLFITLDSKLAVGDTTEFSLAWSGDIVEYLAFPEIEPEEFYGSLSMSMVNIGKRYSFIEPNQVLLTKEVEWYPLPGVGLGTKSWGAGKQFSQFSLKVKTSEELVAVSQGECKEGEPGEFNFPDQGYLSQISLAIGEYETRKVSVEGISIELSYTKGNNYFDSYLTEIGDTIPEILSEMLGDFESGIDLYYQFPELKVVEVPVHFKSYDRFSESGRAEVQPGMLFYPEKGAGVSGLDIMSQKKHAQWRRKEGEQTPKQEQTEWFISMIRATFATELERPNFRRSGAEFKEENVPLYIYPMFYNYTNFMESGSYPVLDRVLDTYTKSSAGTTDMMTLFMRSRTGTSQDESANVLLEDKSLATLLRSIEDPVLLDNVIKLKGDYLFSSLESDMEDGAFAKFLRDMLKEYRFTVLPVDTLNYHMKKKFGIDISSQIEEWYNQVGIPKFLVQSVLAEKVREDEDEYTKVTMDVANMGSVEGLLKVTFMAGGRRGGRGGSSGAESVVKLIQLDANDARRVSFILETTPRMATVNTLCSNNIPASLMFRFDKVELNKEATTDEVNTPISLDLFKPEEGVTIIDNEDDNFVIVGEEVVPPLRRLLKGDETELSPYKGFDLYRPAASWTLTTNSDFYGSYIKSAYYCKGGDGTKSVKWTTNIKEKSYYEVYTHIPPSLSRLKRRYGSDGMGTYSYTISYENGEEEAEVSLKGQITEWMNIGLYHLPEGECTITLTNESSGRAVVADAIKFVKID